MWPGVTCRGAQVHAVTGLVGCWAAHHYLGRGVSGADVQALVVWSRAERAEYQRGPEKEKLWPLRMCCSREGKKHDVGNRSLRFFLARARELASAQTLRAGKGHVTCFVMPSDF